MKHILIISIFSLVALQVNAQLKVKMAANYFDNLAYIKAAPIYNELADKYIAKNHGDKSYLLRAAISNSKISNYNKSVSYFDALFASDKTIFSESDYFTYINNLRILEQYQKSEDVAKSALQTFPSNKYFQLIANGGDTFQEIVNKGKNNKTEKMSFNSGLGDFAPVRYQDGIVFATRSKQKGFLVGKYAWDGADFTKLVYTHQKDGKWKKPVLLGGVFSSRKHDGPVAFSKDGNQMLLTRDIAKTGNKSKKDLHRLALFISTKDAKGKWGVLQQLPFSTSEFNNGQGCFSADGKRIYFVSDRTGSVGGTDIFYSDLTGDSWSTPQNLKDVNTVGDEMFPYIGKDGKLFFSSNGLLGLGGLDLYAYDLNGGSNSPVNLGGNINTSYDDFGLMTDSTSNFKGFLSSNRDNRIDRIYAWEGKSPIANLKVNVLAGYSNMKPLANQIVWLIDSKTKDTTSYQTDNDGNITSALKNDRDYYLTTQKPDYQLKSTVVFNTRNLSDDSTYIYSLNLQPLLATVNFHVLDKKTKHPLSNTTIEIYDEVNKKDTTLTTDENGNVKTIVYRDKILNYTSEKKDYLDASSQFSVEKEQDEISLDVPMTKIVRGIVFKVDNIFYDLNKATLRPESMEALDKLAEFILKNDIKVELSSHTDSRGSNAYNMKLSQQRAQSCVDYLVKTKGVSKRMIIAKGYGETRPVNGCKDGVPCTEEQYQENRRTEVKILDVR